MYDFVHKDVLVFWFELHIAVANGKYKIHNRWVYDIKSKNL